MEDPAMRDGPYGDATGYACPRCGGGLWRRDDGDDGDGAAGPRCRIGHAFRPEQLWIEHCAARNRALAEATRALAENAALARAMADEARALGNDALAG
jgi:two-component system chemotaxis response regulator CheB